MGARRRGAGAKRGAAAGGVGFLSVSKREVVCRGGSEKLSIILYFFFDFRKINRRIKKFEKCTSPE
jgi:hypothetical protein